MAAKRIRKLLVWGLFLQVSLVFSQTTFQKTFGGSGNESATWVTEASNGYVISGIVTSTNGNQDALLVHLDASGNAIWQKRFGAGQSDAFNCVIATNDGGFLAVGETSSFGTGDADIFLVKVNASGLVLWSKTIGDADHNEVARGIVPVEDGGFVVSGYSILSTGTASRSVFLRFDQNGNMIWSRTYKTSVGNLFLSSYIDGNIIYASGGADAEGVFVRIDLFTGNVLSSKAFAGSGPEALYYQQPTQDGNLLIADHTWSASTGTDIEAWVQKINRTSGQVIWSKVYYRANDNIRGRIEKVDDGGFLLVPYDNFNTTQADALLAKIDANGNLLWSYNYGGNASDRLLKAVQTADGGFIAVGDTRSSSGNSSSDMLIVKTDFEGHINGTCSKDANILSLDFVAGNPIVATMEAPGVQASPLKISPLPLNLLGQSFMPNAVPVILKTIPLCPNRSYNIAGTAYYAPKMVIDTVTSLNGCDTIIHYSLTLNAFNTGIHVIGLCKGETYPIDGIQYSAPATIIDTIPSLTGDCDTIYTYVLKAWSQPTAAYTISFCSGESVIIGGQTYMHSGQVQSYVPSTGVGCDTLVTFTLIERPQPTRSETRSFCPGESVLIGGHLYNQSGVVVANIVATNGGCDTIVTYTLELRPQPMRSETRRFCPGESVLIGGQLYNQSGVVVANIASTNGGCDTIVTYNLELRTQPTRSETRSFCPGESVLIGGQLYNQSGVVVSNIASTNGGCDTIVTYNLELRPQPTRSETRSFCPGESVLIGGQSYIQSGTVVANLASTMGGCDTIVTYTLELRSQPTRSEIRSFCPGESVMIAGHSYTQPGVVVGYVPSSLAGFCDTVVTYTLQYLTPAPSNISIQCPHDIAKVIPAGSSPIAVNYTVPVAASDCICPGLEISRVNGPASGDLFQVGFTQICYNVKDNCGQEKPCCFSVNIREEDPCDVKENGCLKYELLNITADAIGNYTYRIRVTNNCPYKLVYTAIQIPDGLIAIDPANNSTFKTVRERNYMVRCPNFSPMYSIRFKSTTDSIANGESDIFEYTLPVQSSEVTYINITSRLANQDLYEAHLNTFYCPVGITLNNRTEKLIAKDQVTLPPPNPVLLFPNPTTAVLYADLSDWQGQNLKIRITNIQGQLVHSMKLHSDEDLLRVEMPKALNPGIYFMEIASEQGRKEVLRFMLQY